MPRIPPKEPAEALTTFQVAPGFRIEQVAAEPLVTDPVAIAFDENGRLFVVEMRGYSENKDEKVSRIRLLEDTNGDGKFDKSTIFVDGLAWPTAVFCWDGGVFVADAPDILYFKDTDGDGKADERQRALHGLGHEQRAGADQLVSVGPRQSHLRARQQQRGAALQRGDDKTRKPLAIRGRDFAIDPRDLGRHAGQRRRAARHVVRRLGRPVRLLQQRSPPAGDVRGPLPRPAIRISPRPRRGGASPPTARRPMCFAPAPSSRGGSSARGCASQAIVPGIVEGGGRPAGYFTGATGATIYRGDAWPSEWHGLAIVGDVGSNLVHRKRLEPDGVGFIGRRIDEKSEFVSSSDIWFRPVQFANAPDGTLYILDMYREVIEHPASLPPLIKKHLDLTSGRDRGRIYRVVPDGFKQPPLPQLASARRRSLVALLQHPNGWHRDTAARLLYERQDKAAIAPLAKLATESQLPLARMHALYALDGLNALDRRDCSCRD